MSVDEDETLKEKDQEQIAHDFMAPLLNCIFDYVHDPQNFKASACDNVMRFYA